MLGKGSTEAQQSEVGRFKELQATCAGHHD